MIARLPLVLLAAVTLPFVTFWLDYEAARRTLLCLGVGAAMVVASLRGPRFPVGTATNAFAVLLGFALLSLLWAANPLVGAARFAYFAALWGCLQLGLRAKPEVWIRASLPITLVVAALGLAQALGLAWPAGVRITESPASTLGNLNVASEVVALGVAASLLPLRERARPLLPALALVVGAAYLVVNGSRSGQLASGVALLLATVAPAAAGAPRLVRRTLQLVPLAGLGVLCGLAANALRPAARELATTKVDAASPERVAAPSTIAVREELWRGTLALAAEHPWRGQGAGHFRIEYPRHRRDAEIELSSFSRSFRTTVDTAHNDLLELAVEFGITGIVASLVFAFALARAAWRHGASHLAPLAAFGVLAMVRSPLANAPAAAWLFGYAGALLAGHGTRERTLPRLGGTAPFVLLWCGVLLLAGLLLRVDLAAARYLETRALRPTEAQDLATLEALQRVASQEPRLVALAARHYAATLPPKEALAKIERFGGTVAPHEPGLWFLRATLAHAAGRSDLAWTALAEVQRLDPRDPEAALLRAVLHTEAGDAVAAFRALTGDVHPKVRAGLAQHLGELATHAERRRDATTALRLRAEEAFAIALERALAARDDAARLAVLRDVDALRDAFALAGLAARDARPLLLRAALQAARGQSQLVKDLGELASEKGLAVPAEARTLLADIVAPLRQVPAWQPVLNW